MDNQQGGTGEDQRSEDQRQSPEVPPAPSTTTAGESSATLGNTSSNDYPATSNEQGAAASGDQHESPEDRSPPSDASVT